MFTRYGASLIAFGHHYGLQSIRRSHGHNRIKAKPIIVKELTMTARDMGVTYDSDPELYRACHPLFDGRERTHTENERIQAENAPQPTTLKPEPTLVQTVQQPGQFKPVTGWTWEVTR
jgi:hypothetical protein